MEEKLTTQLKGKITEMQVAIYFLQQGYIVSQPLVDTRYDFLLEVRNKIFKIQVKTSSLIVNENNEIEAIEFKTCNTHTNTHGTTNRNYKGQIDYFATFYNNTCYLIPIEECGSRSKKLRILPPKNNQVKGINYLKDYQIEKILPND